MTLVLVGVARVAAAEPGTVAVYWQPPGQPAPAAEARRAFSDAAQRAGARVIDASAQPAAAAPSLKPALEAASADYARFKFDDALARLDELERLAVAQGGGDLDERQLSELYLYRGLCRLEKGDEAAAWEDLVRAARLDPARIMDPQRFPPRAVATYKRAAAEVAQLPHTQLTLEAPADAAVRVDGAQAGATTPVTVGPHFVSVTAEGFEPWAGVVSVTPARNRFQPPLHALQPPDGDRLLALAGNPSSGRLLVGALERAPAGWRFVARDVALPDGKFVSDAVVLGDAPVRPAVEALVARVTSPTLFALPAPPAMRRRWWPWAVGAGGAAVVIAVAVTLGVVLGTPETGTVGASLGLPR